MDFISEKYISYLIIVVRCIVLHLGLPRLSGFLIVLSFVEYYLQGV